MGEARDSMFRFLLFFILLPLRVVFFLIQSIVFRFYKKSKVVLELPSDFKIFETTFLQKILQPQKDEFHFIEWIVFLRSLRYLPNLKKIVFHIPQLNWGISETYSIAEEISSLKNKGIEIETIVETGSLPALYLLNISDQRKCFDHTEFTIMLPAVDSLFWGDFLKGFGIEVDVFQSGDYKSFGEVFTRTEFSKKARENLSILIHDLQSTIQEKIIPPPSKTVSILLAKDLKQSGFLHDLLIDWPEDPLDSPYIGWKRGRLKDFRFFPIKRSTIAILPLKGEITGGDPKQESVSMGKIQYYPLKKILSELKEDKNVDSIILEIESPGGSSFFSESIAKAIDSIAKKKPVYAYIQGVGASGGYYIALSCKKIVSTPFTVLGSIGAVFLRPNLRKFIHKNRINEDRIGFYPTREIFSLMGDLTKPSIQLIKKQVRESEDCFYGRVVQSRKLDPKLMDSLGGGRVFSSKKSLESGLIDSISSMGDLIFSIIDENKKNNWSIEYILPEWKLQSSFSRFSLSSNWDEVLNKPLLMDFRFMNLNFSQLFSNGYRERGIEGLLGGYRRTNFVSRTIHIP